MFAPASVGQLSTSRHQQLREITLRNRLRTQPLDRIPALGESLLGLIDRIVQRSLGFIGSSQHQVASCLKLEHQAVKILQQRVVQFSRNTRAFVHTRFQPDVELPLQLLDTQLVDTPQQCYESDRAQRTEPPGLVV